MTLKERALRLRYNVIPDHLIGEILTKRGTDNAIPFLALVITVAGFGSAISGFFKPQSLTDSTRQLGEFSIVVTGLTIVMLGGGIDLSVGSIFALSGDGFNQADLDTFARMQVDMRSLPGLETAHRHSRLRRIALGAVPTAAPTERR